MPSGMLVGPVRLKVTAGAAGLFAGGGGGCRSATARLDDEEESATLVAVIITGEDEGAVCGAV